MLIKDACVSVYMDQLTLKEKDTAFKIVENLQKELKKFQKRKPTKGKHTDQMYKHGEINGRQDSIMAILNMM